MVGGGSTGRLVVLVVCTAALAMATGCTASQPGGYPSQDVSASGAPTPTATPKHLTRTDYLAQTARMFGVEDPPDVDVVRAVEPEELPALVTQCMAESGFVADSTGTITVPSDQTESLDLAYYTCYARYPIDEKYLQPLNAGQRRYIYRYWIDSEIPCLAGLGYSIPAPPSEQTYLDSIGTPDEYVVSSQLYDLGLSESVVGAALSKCPETPRAADVYQH